MRTGEGFEDVMSVETVMWTLEFRKEKGIASRYKERLEKIGFAITEEKVIALNKIVVT